MDKAVVTGGAGFIGSHLAEALVKRACSVIILDDLSTGRTENIQGLMERGEVQFVRGSVTNLSLLQGLFRGVSYVFHEAAIPSVPKSVADPLGTNETNVSGTLNVLLAARDNHVRKVVYASSCAVYGAGPVLPKREDMVPEPQSPYAVSKLTGEYYCQVFREIYGLNTVCLRYFNVYGPRQDPNSQYAGVIARFLKCAARGEPLTVYDDGEQTRDFVYVADVVSANLLAAEKGVTGTFNIGRGAKTSINQLAEIVVKLSGMEVRIVHHESRVGDIRHSLSDISKAKKALGFAPAYDLEAGLRETRVSQ